MNPSTMDLHHELAPKLRRRFPGLLALLFLPFVAGAAPACGGTSLVAPATTYTDTFTGPMTRNFSYTYPFTAQQAGTVTASYQSIGTDNTTVLGLALGTWNGSACDITLENDSATVGVIVSGTVSAAGNLCLRVYDVGFVISPLTYVVQVVHP
jgi:hypothetical protein